MKLSLLDIVQDILNEMDGDTVNSIDDTVEAQQVAQIVKTTYLEMMANRNWPHLQTGFSCSSFTDVDYPTSLALPENIKELRWIKYNKRTSTDVKDKWDGLTYLQPEDFFTHCAGRDSSASNVQVVNISGVKLNIRNDVVPTYWTTFNDSSLILDSWDSAVDSVLQTGKNSCWGIKSPQWSGLDNSVPDLPAEAFPALLEEAMSNAFRTPLSRCHSMLCG